MVKSHTILQHVKEWGAVFATIVSLIAVAAALGKPYVAWATTQNQVKANTNAITVLQAELQTLKTGQDSLDISLTEGKSQIAVVQGDVKKILFLLGQNSRSGASYDAR